MATPLQSVCGYHLGLCEPVKHIEIHNKLYDQLIVLLVKLQLIDVSSYITDTIKGLSNKLFKICVYLSKLLT